MRVMTFTSVPVKPDTLKRLRAYKTGGKSYDAVLNELMDDHPAEEFLAEHVRRLKEEPRSAWADVRKRILRDE